MSAILSSRAAGRPLDRLQQPYHWLSVVPYAVLALPLRAAVANVFWSSGQTKIADWSATLALFRDEYKVPLLPPNVAAQMATGIELSVPPLLILGLLTRPAVAVLLGMIAVIQIFVYPQAWPDHIQYFAILLVLLCRGPGLLSLDALVGRLFRRNAAT